MSQGQTFDNTNIISTWSTPIRITGDNGKDGANGTNGTNGADAISYWLDVSPLTVTITGNESNSYSPT